MFVFRLKKIRLFFARNLLLIAGLILLFVLTTLYNAQSYGFRKQIHGISQLAQSKLESAYSNVYEFIHIIVKAKQLSRENKMLRAEVMQLHSKTDCIEKIQIENAALRKQTRFVDSEKYNIVTAKLNLRGKSPNQKSGYLFAGSVHGIKKNCPVLHRGNLIGVTKEVFEENSIVEFIDSKNINIPVVSQFTGHNFIIRGNNNLVAVSTHREEKTTRRRRVFNYIWKRKNFSIWPPCCNYRQSG